MNQTNLQSLKQLPTSFDFLLFSCVQPFIQFSHHLTIRLFAISTLSFPQGRFYPSFLEGFHSPTGLLSYLDIGQSTRWKFKGGGKKKEKTTSTLHIQSPADIPFSFLNRCVFPKLLIKMASTWPPPLPLYFLSIHGCKNQQRGKRHRRGLSDKKETSFYFYFSSWQTCVGL